MSDVRAPTFEMVTLAVVASVLALEAVATGAPTENSALPSWPFKSRPEACWVLALCATAVAICPS